MSDSLRVLGVAREVTREHVAFGDEWETRTAEYVAGEDLNVRNIARDQSRHNRRERTEVHIHALQVRPTECKTEPASYLPLALTAAVTGTAGISIPGIIGGTIPGIYRYKDQQPMLVRVRQTNL